MNETKLRKPRPTTRDKSPAVHRNESPSPQHGLVVGVLAGFANPEAPLVTFDGNPDAKPMKARAFVAIGVEDIGKPVALQFELGDIHRPAIIGLIRASARNERSTPPTPVANLVQEVLELTKSEEEILLVAKRKVTLKCGNASITLDADGKIELRGEYILSRSAGQNRIKGSSVSLN
jgi:hypothetical protein